MCVSCAAYLEPVHSKMLCRNSLPQLMQHTRCIIRQPAPGFCAFEAIKRGWDRDTATLCLTWTFHHPHQGGYIHADQQHTCLRDHLKPQPCPLCRVTPTTQRPAQSMVLPARIVRRLISSKDRHLTHTTSHLWPLPASLHTPRVHLLMSRQNDDAGSND